MAVSLTYGFTANISETLASGVDGSSQPVINHSSFDDTGTLNASSTPPATKCVVRTIALIAGAYTIDLTTITGTNGLAQDMTGLKVQYFRVKNLGASAMTFTFGASNPYLLKGAAWKTILEQNQIDVFYGNDATPDVGGSSKTIDVSGTGTQTFELTIVAG